MGEDVCDGVNGCVKVDGASLSGRARDGRMLIEGDSGGIRGQGSDDGVVCESARGDVLDKVTSQKATLVAADVDVCGIPIARV